MIRPVTLVWIGLAAVIAISLFLVKYKVQDLDDQLAALETEKRKTQEAIHVLEAEWTYLNRPERLENLASKHLTLEPASPAQLVVYDAPARAAARTSRAIRIDTTGGGQ